MIEFLAILSAVIATVLIPIISWKIVRSWVRDRREAQQRKLPAALRGER